LTERALTHSTKKNFCGNANITASRLLRYFPGF